MPDRLRIKQSNLFIHTNSAYIGAGKSETLKWKALSVNAKANKGLFREIESDELLSGQKNKEDSKAIKRLIQGEKNNVTEKKGRSQALASVASRGGGGGSTKNANRLKKLLSQSDETDDSKKSPAKESGWAKIKKQISKNAENFPSPNRDTGPDLVAIVKAAKGGGDDEESKARLALVRDARKASKQIKKHIKSTSQWAEEAVDMGQRRPDKKSRKLQAQISSSSHYLFDRLCQLNSIFIGNCQFLISKLHTSI